jgi:hypothetical protein
MLPRLPAEVQKAVLLSLDYASLCQIRSTGRHFFNLLTEAEIHSIFLDIKVPTADYSMYTYGVGHADIITAGTTCGFCAAYCDATEADEERTDARMKLEKKKLKDARETRANAIDETNVVKKALRKARAVLKNAEKAGKTKKELKEERAVVSEAESQVKSAKKTVKAADEAVLTAVHTVEWPVPMEIPDVVRTCGQCKRKYNGYKAPGYLHSKSSTQEEKRFTSTHACSRTSHYNIRTFHLNIDAHFDAMQKDGKICKICWGSGRRGAAGLQRRRAFTEEFGYWLRGTWLLEGQAIKTRAAIVAGKSLEDIEKSAEYAKEIEAMGLSG